MSTIDIAFVFENVLGWVQEGGESNFERFSINLDL